MLCPSRASTLRLSLLVVLATACDKKPDAGTAPAASTLAPSALADGGSAQTLVFTLEKSGTTRIDMPGKSEHIRASTSAAEGTLTVNPTALADTRGEIRIDLTTLTTQTFGDPKRDGDQTTHARTWLEAVVDGKVQEPYRHAALAIRSVEIVGESNLAKIPLVQTDAGLSVRHVSAVVHADVLVHGHKVERAVPVGIDFAYPTQQAPAEAPSRLRIRTEKPLTLTLKEHEVMPRDPVGKVLEWTSELTHRVATEALVDVDLEATASSR